MDLILVLIILVVVTVQVVDVGVLRISYEYESKGYKQDGNDQEYHTTTFVIACSLFYRPCLNEFSLLTKMIMILIDVFNVWWCSVHNQ